MLEDALEKHKIEMAEIFSDLEKLIEELEDI
jgi:hypothetical protein